jgi:hypothetical protein
MVWLCGRRLICSARVAPHDGSAKDILNDLCRFRSHCAPERTPRRITLDLSKRTLAWPT